MPCNAPQPPSAIEETDDEEAGMEIIEVFDVPEDESFLTFSGHEGAVFCCGFNNAGTLAVSGGQDDKGFVWDATNGEIKFECTDQKDSVVFSQFSPDDSYVATADMSGIIQVWNTATGSKTWSFETPEITMMQWDNKDNMLFAGTTDGSLWKWSIPDGDTRFSQVTESAISSCGFLPNGKELVIGYYDGSVIFFETQNLTVTKSVFGDNHKENVIVVDCHKDNTLVATGSQDGHAKVIKATTGKVLWTADCLALEISSGDDSEGSSVESVAFCESHPILATGTSKGFLTFWDLSSQAQRSFSRLSDDAIIKMIFKKNSPLLYTVTAGYDMALYDCRTGEVERKWEGHHGTILAFDLSRDETKLLSGGDDKHCKIFSVQ